MRNCLEAVNKKSGAAYDSIEGAGRHDRRFFSTAMVGTYEDSCERGFAGAIEVRRSCGGERSDAGALSEKTEEPFGALVRHFARRFSGDSSASGRAEPQRVGALLF
jgi:hypothetical protein